MKESSDTKAARFVAAGLGDELVTMTVSLKAKTIMHLTDAAKVLNMPMRQYIEHLIEKGDKRK